MEESFVQKTFNFDFVAFEKSCFPKEEGKGPMENIKAPERRNILFLR